MSSDINLKRIEGTPTKELFVFILTRDLSIKDAINDLIDNCIDGAKRLRQDGSYNGLWIDIRIDENSFSIDDNCGGIPINIARKYAFRFGRPAEMPNTDFSIGQFGVGMKRAFFKLGEAFYVESKHSNSEFAITVNINDWLKKQNTDLSEDWSFEFEDDFKEDQNNPVEETGTKIEITPIHEDISKYIIETDFISDLKQDIEFKHMENIYKGMKITVNEEELKCKRPQFLVSDQLKIAEFTKKLSRDVNLRIICGIGEQVREEGGWYIFCNDRLLLGPEQTSLTGWTGIGGGGVAIYHQQFWRFRGIVYFEAKNSYNLPWNTAKNNIDASSPAFLFARGKMIEMMKPVIKYLNLVKKDRETLPDGSQKEEKPYEDMIKEAKKVKIENLEVKYFERIFSVPSIKIKKESVKFVTITYRKPKEIAEIAKEAIGADSYKELGEMTFDYFVEQEELENEQ